MSVVYEIGITEKNNQEIEKKEIIEVVASKGIVGDRYFHDFNGDREQITLIESENIDYYNNTFNTKFTYLEFRRNIVTKGIRLNDLLEKKIAIGSVILDVIDLCRPCRHLSEKLHRNDIIKEFLRKGGIRCQIMKNGKITLSDQIKII